MKAKIAKSLLKINLGLSLLISSSFASANQCVDNSSFLDVGYQLGAKQLSLLASPLINKRNQKKTDEQKISSIKANIEKIWKKSEIQDINSQKLAEIITQVSNSIGVDHQILASIIKQESGYCLSRWNKKGGDSGCVQLTDPGINELKHQFGLDGESKFSGNSPEVLTKLVAKFYHGDDIKVQKYLKWLSQKPEKIKVSLRTGKNHDIDIISGAILLKIKVVVADGNYSVGIRNYNGSKKKYAYQRNVLNYANKVAFIDSSVESCNDNAEFEQEVYKNVCDMTDDSAACMQNYFMTLPNAT